MNRKAWLCGSMMLLILAIPAAFGYAREDAPPEAPPVPSIPGITAEDMYPNACVDCHINYVEMKRDTRFSTLMSQWSEQVEPGLLAKSQASAPEGVTLRGKHPKADSALKDIPAKCLVCHRSASKTAPPFAGLMHGIHLAGGEQNHFVLMFQGSCTHCHKLDASSGRFRIPSAPEKQE